MGLPTYMRPVGDAVDAERRKGGDPIQCDECGRVRKPWVIRRVVATLVCSKQNTSQGAYHFCVDCHLRVFREASHEKYPLLFEETVELTEAMTTWQTANEMAEHFGFSDGKSLSGRLRESNTLFGRTFEMTHDGRTKLYRVVE
jgi:hypothetical protein